MVTAITRTAYPRLSSILPGRELLEEFTPTDDELAWAISRTNEERHRLALVLLLKAYQRIGYFPKLDEVPDLAVDHVRGLLGIGPGIKASHASERNAKLHRSYIRTRLGVTYRAAEVRKIAAEAIEAAAQSKDNPADLINVAIEELVRARCELPGYSTLDEVVAKIRQRVNTGVYTTVFWRVDPPCKVRLTRLLKVDPVTRRSEFDGLKTPPGSPSLSQFKARLALLCRLDALGDTAAWLEDIPAQKIGHFAGEARALVASDLRRTGEEKQLTLLICLLHETRATVRDQVAEMFCKRMATIHKKGRERLEELRETHRVESERLLVVLGDVLAAAHDAAEETSGGADTERLATATGSAVLDVLAAGGGIDRLRDSHEAVSAHHGNNYLPVLEGFYRSHRPALFTLLDGVELLATTAETSVLDAVAFLKANRARIGEHMSDAVTTTNPDGTQTVLHCDLDAFASQAWRSIVREKNHPGKLVRRHLEVCVFSYLASELRSGDIAVVGADSYANLHDQLMDWDACRPLVQGFCEQAGIPATAPAMTAHYRELLATAAQRVDEGYPANTDRVLDGDRPVLKRRKGTERRASAISLEAAVAARLPERGLLEIMTRTAHLLGWHRHFGPASGSDPKIRDAIGRYILTVFTYGTLLGPAQVARHMKGQVSAQELYTAGNKHATATKIERACADIVNA